VQCAYCQAQYALATLEAAHPNHKLAAGVLLWRSLYAICQFCVSGKSTSRIIAYISHIAVNA
jgi:hypothetical protein